MTQLASSSAGGLASAKNSLRTSYGLRRSFEPLYSGGASTAISSDGRYLFAPVNDEVQVTNVESGAICAKIPSDMEEITCLTLTPDQSALIVASRSMALRIFALTFPRGDEDEKSDDDGGGRIRWTLQRTVAKTHDAPVVIMRVDPTSTLVATGSSDTCAKVWDLRGGFCTHVFRGHGGVVSSLAWNMPSALLSASRRIELFTGSIDGRIRQWDLKNSASGGSTTKPIAILESHFSVVRGLDVSQDGRRMISAGRDRMLAFWERRPKGTERGQGAVRSAGEAWHVVETVTASEALESAGFLDDGDTFWTAGSEGEARLWSFIKRGLIRLQPGGRFSSGLVLKRAVEEGEGNEEEGEDETRAVTEVHYLPQSRTLVTVHADQEIVFRSSETLTRSKQLAGFTDQIIDALLLSPDEKRPDSHLAVATNSTVIRVYSLLADSFSVDALPADSGSEEGHTGLILCLDKTSDGKWLASGGKDRIVRIWAYVPQPQSGVQSSSFDDEIGVPVNGKKGRDALIKVEMGWSCVALAEGHTESVGALAFARRPAMSSGSTPEIGAPFLVTGSQDRTAKVWDLSKLGQHVTNSFAAHGGSRTPLRLSSLTTLKIHDKDINALDVSPNNALLLTGSQDRTAKVFAIQYQAPSKANAYTATAALKLVTACQGHKRGIWSVAFSPADAVFLTASSDRTMKLWSINDNFTCVKTYVGHTNSVLRARFLRGSSGLQCISSASDGLVKVWNVRSEECLDTLDGHEERVWGLDCTQDGATVISAGADGVIRFWQDETVKRQEEELQKRQQDVEQEQTFGNLLAVRDYRNAISLSLAMQQPRRLFELFKAVDQQRAHHGDQAAADATAALMHEAVSRTGRSSKSAASLRDPALAEVLVRAGVFPSSAKRALRPSKAAQEEEEATITGLASVDEVIATLQPAQLATLLTFVRDWNTTVRTANVAQTVLHAILRFHSADAIIRAFELQNRSSNADREKAAEVLPQSAAGVRRKPGKQSADLANVLDALLPYTRRHYDRAQRILTESAMVEYTLANMDAVLGLDEEEEQAEEDETGNGRVLAGEDGDTSMQDDTESVSSAEEREED